jgi:hypothetical protein
MRKRVSYKGRIDNGGGFLALPHRVMASPAFRGLSAHAVKLLCDIGGQYRGKNNGDLGVSWRVMQPLGWRSRDTLTRALRELRRAGLIELTRQGGMNFCSLYALTWHPIDDCKGKLDVPATCKPSALWKRTAVVEEKNASTVAVSARRGSRVDGTPESPLPTRDAC